MRTPILLAAVAIVAGACSASTYTGPSTAVAPAHAGWTPAPRDDGPTPAPVGTPYDGVTFDDPGVNPNVQTARDRESTFGLDVDTASYSIAQRFVDDGKLPDPASVRVEEFVNSFDHDYPAPRDGTFALYGDGGQSPFLQRDEVLLRLGVKAREVSDEARRDAALTFVVDTSGSMQREDRLGLVKQALTFLVDRLDGADSVAIVTYGSDARVVLEPTSVSDSGTIVRAIDRLHTDGSTNAEAGLALGYRLAANTFREDAINRVILASDGVANTGATDPAGILQRINWDASLGIQLVTVGFGMGNYNDALMEQLADKGDGFYAYVNTFDDARTLFGDRLTSTLQTVALDARAQLELDPAVVESYRLLGYENRDIADDQFRDDSVDAGAIGAGHAVTALYALRLTGERGDDDRLGTLHLRWTDPDDHQAHETRLDIDSRAVAPGFRNTDPTFQRDALVAATAEVLRESRSGSAYSLHNVLSAATDAELPSDRGTEDFLRFLEHAASLER